MASTLVFGWFLLAVISLMLVGQYGRQIRSEPDDQDQTAGPALVFVRSTGAIGSVVQLLFNGAQRTAEYVFDMSRWVLVAFGLIGGGILGILVGMLQFDPVAWFYVGTAIVSSMEVFGVGLVSEPWLALGAVGALFAVAFLVKWGAAKAYDD